MSKLSHPECESCGHQFPTYDDEGLVIEPARADLPVYSVAIQEDDQYRSLKFCSWSCLTEWKEDGSTGGGD